MFVKYLINCEQVLIHSKKMYSQNQDLTVTTANVFVKKLKLDFLCFLCFLLDKKILRLFTYDPNLLMFVVREGEFEELS